MLKIVALDIDGVLAEYPQHWINWVCSKKNNFYCFSDLKQMKDNIPYSEYLQLKEEYRLSGEKINISEIEGAREFANKLTEKGYFIILLTARPVDKYPKVLEDTLQWLKKHQIHYDWFFMGKDKWSQVLKYFPTLQFLIEDNAFIANEVAKFGYRVYLLDNKYNQQPLHKTVIRIFHLSEVLEHEKLSSAAIAGNIE